MKRTNLKKLRKGTVRESGIGRRKGFSPTRPMPQRGLDLPFYREPGPGATNYKDSIRSSSELDFLVAMAALMSFRRKP